MDNFATLGQARQPWIDPDLLKAAFLEISAQAHPDRAAPADREAATKRYAELNAAYNCLTDPKQRVLHLLELELGAPPENVQDIGQGTMELSLEVGQLCRQADGILAGKAKQGSPLLQVEHLVQGMDCAKTLGELQRRIRLRRDEFLEELKGMNDAWDAAPPPGSPNRVSALPLRRLEEIGRELSYNTRWSSQIHERIVQLLM